MQLNDSREVLKITFVIAPTALHIRGLSSGLMSMDMTFSLNMFARVSHSLVYFFFALIIYDVQILQFTEIIAKTCTKLHRTTDISHYLRRDETHANLLLSS